MPESLTLKECLAHLWSYLSGNRRKFFGALFLTVMTCVIYAIMPIVEGQVITQIQKDVTAITQGIPGAHIQFDAIAQILLGLFAVFLCKISFQYLSVFWLTDSIQSTMADLRSAVEAKISRLPVAYFDQHKTGELLSKITNDIETVSNALQQTLSRIISAVVCTLLFSAVMIRLNWRMYLVVLAGLCISGLLVLFVLRRSQPVFDRQQAALSDMNGTINEMYSGISEIIIYNRQDFAKAQFTAVNQTMRKESYLAQALSGLISPLTSFMTYLVIAFTAFYGSFQVLAGTLMLGQLQAFIRYIWNINDPISQLSQMSNAMQSAFSGMNRLFSFLDLEEVELTSTKKPLGPVETVAFEHVGFDYGKADPRNPLMKDISFTAGKNQTVAIVGHTGAGKTTLTNLLLRFYPIDSGSIQINGTDIRDLSFADLRDKIGLVLQDPWLFEGTIEENLRYAADNLREADLQNAVATARLQETIAALPDGLQTKLEENAQNLSQGEKQLLTIARAILKNPEILVLDEATSSVDTRLEKRLQAAMASVMENRLCFVIAHRLSTIVNADLILVMDHGNLIESGTHEELLKKGGAYARLYQSQFGQDTLPEA